MSCALTAGSVFVQISSSSTEMLALYEIQYDRRLLIRHHGFVGRSRETTNESSFMVAISCKNFVVVALISLVVLSRLVR